MNHSREEMLSAIRSALRDRMGGDGIERDWAGAFGSSAAGGGGVGPLGSIDLLQARISDYKATVLRCHEGALSDSILKRLRVRRVKRLVAPHDIPEEWISGASSAGVEILRDGDPSILSTAQLASFDGVISGCALAIAETGTLVLDGGPGQGRRAISLLPYYHLCVVTMDQVVDTISDGISRLQHSLGASPGPLTLISGPSATSDIELIRVEGVHGPRILDVILVENP